MVERARDGDELMVEVGLAEVVQPLDRRVDNGDVAFTGESETLRVPVLFSHLEDFVERVAVLVALVGEVDLPGGNVSCGDVLDVPRCIASRNVNV